MVPRSDDVHAERDEVCGKREQPFHLTVCKAVLDDDILANAVAQAPQALLERLHEMERSLPRRDREVAHPVDPSRRVLRAHAERQRDRRATYEHNARAPLQSMTSSASPTSDGAMVMPSA